MGPAVEQRPLTFGHGVEKKWVVILALKVWHSSLWVPPFAACLFDFDLGQFGLDFGLDFGHDFGLDFGLVGRGSKCLVGLVLELHLCDVGVDVVTFELLERLGVIANEFQGLKKYHFVIFRLFSFSMHYPF